MSIPRVRVVHAFLGALFVLTAFLGGCSYAYQFSLKVTAKNAADGKPLSGVKMSLNLHGQTDHANNDQLVANATDSEGMITFPFRVSESAFMEPRKKWYLKLAKKGYIDEIIDITPTGEPEAGQKSPSMIVVVAYLRPAN
jgi:hypothetical protein